jgi:hypothetical protein
MTYRNQEVASTQTHYTQTLLVGGAHPALAAIEGSG